MGYESKMIQNKKMPSQMEHACPLGGDIANDCDGCA